MAMYGPRIQTVLGITRGLLKIIRNPVDLVDAAEKTEVREGD
jgi:hypothetical protein